MSLLDRRIALVTGKGGVGKTTVSIALASMAAAAGKRAIITETAGARLIPGIFGATSRGYEPVELAPNLWSLSITPEEAIEDYIVQQIKVRRLYKLVFQNRVMGPFMDAVPGLHDVIQLGKVFDLHREVGRDGRPRWDFIVVDAPATGHGITMLGAPRSLMEMTRRGPFFEGARQVHDVMDDPTQTAVVLVSLPEEMPVNETLDLWGRLGRTQEQVGLCVLNEVHPAPFADSLPDGDWAVARAVLEAHADLGVREAAALTDGWLRRLSRQDAARARLREGLPSPVVDLPFLFHRDLEPVELARLGAALAPAVLGAK